MIQNIETDSANVDEDLFCFVLSHNVLPTRMGFSPLEVLKGGNLPPECVEGLDMPVPVKSEMSAFNFMSEIWSKRNEQKLADTKPLEVLPAFPKGSPVVWRAQINPSTIKTAKGVVVDASPTAALVRFSSRRLAWCSSKQLKLDVSASLDGVLNQ